MGEEEIPQTRILDLFTKIDNLIAIQIKTSRRTNELLEMLLGVRPVPPEVVLPPAVVPPRVPIRVPEAVSWEAIRDTLDRIEEILKPVTDYISQEKTVSESYDLKKVLGRTALNGWIANGGPDDLEVKINKKTTIKVENGEVLDFTIYFKRPLEIEYVDVAIPTGDEATYRIMMW